MLHIKHNNNNTDKRFDHQCFRPHSLQATALSGHQNVKRERCQANQNSFTTGKLNHCYEKTHTLYCFLCKQTLRGCVLLLVQSNVK